MKMMRKNWKSRSAVSPVIATILMVAITVVLAAVLYVMVMGFGDDSSSTPAGQITKVDTVTGGYKLTLSSFSPDTKFTDLKVNVGGEVYKLSDTAGTLDGSGDPTYTIAVTDLGGDKSVSQGDSITITGAGLAGKTVSFVHVPSGGLIAERALPAA